MKSLHKFLVNKKVSNIDISCKHIEDKNIVNTIKKLINANILSSENVSTNYPKCALKLTFANDVVIQFWKTFARELDGGAITKFKTNEEVINSIETLLDYDFSHGKTTHHIVIRYDKNTINDNKDKIINLFNKYVTKNPINKSKTAVRRGGMLDTLVGEFDEKGKILGFLSNLESLL